MVGPRDQLVPPGTPINSETGQPLTEAQLRSLDGIKHAGAALYEAMHFAEGSTPPAQFEEHHWQNRRMQIAATHVETALMFARKAALE